MLKLLANVRIRIGVFITDVINLFKYCDILDRTLSYVSVHIGQFDIIYIYCEKGFLFERKVSILGRKDEHYSKKIQAKYLDTPISDYQFIYDLLAEITQRYIGTILSADIFIEKNSCECYIFPSERGTVKIYRRGKILSEEELYTYEEDV